MFNVSGRWRVLITHHCPFAHLEAQDSHTPGPCVTSQLKSMDQIAAMAERHGHGRSL